MVMSLFPGAAATAKALVEAVKRPGTPPAILMQYLRELLLAFFKAPAAGPLDGTAQLAQHPLLAKTPERASPRAHSCRAAMQFLVAVQRVEEKLTLPIADFSHPEALLDWYVQSDVRAWLNPEGPAIASRSWCTTSARRRRTT